LVLLVWMNYVLLVSCQWRSEVDESVIAVKIPSDTDFVYM
jgi:hypothetical protein